MSWLKRIFRGDRGHWSHEDLMKAVGAGDRARVKTLLTSDYHKRSPACPVFSKEIALRAACRGGHADIVELLVADRVSSRPLVEDERTPMMYAAESGNEKAVRTLLATGSRGWLNHKLEDNGTAVDIAERAGHVSIANLLRDAGGKSASQLEEIKASVASMDDAQMADLLRQLCGAYTRDVRDEISRLQPWATEIGEELNRRGGIEEMRRLWWQLDNMPGARTLDMYWDGIGDWQG